MVGADLGRQVRWQEGVGRGAYMNDKVVTIAAMTIAFFVSKPRNTVLASVLSTAPSKMFLTYNIFSLLDSGIQTASFSAHCIDAAL